MAIGQCLFLYVGVAQLVEHLPFKQGVVGSSPITDTIIEVAQIFSEMIIKLLNTTVIYNFD